MFALSVSQPLVELGTPRPRRKKRVEQSGQPGDDSGVERLAEGASTLASIVYVAHTYVSPKQVLVFAFIRLLAIALQKQFCILVCPARENR